MLNSLLYLQDLQMTRFQEFWRAAMDVICVESMQRAVTALLGESGRVVQSVYFEGNPVTWPLQDTYHSLFRIPRPAPHRHGTDQFIQYQARVTRLRFWRIEGVEVHCPKDRNLLRNRILVAVGSCAPSLFRWLKRHAIKLVTK